MDMTESQSGAPADLSANRRTANTSQVNLNERERSLLFWGSFLALTASAMGFVFRSMVPTLWGQHFEIGAGKVGSLLGAGLWPIAITMVLFSLVVDKIGYRISMYIAFALQGLSVVLTVTATGFDALWFACLCAGAGHGVSEAIINPLVATIYPHDKSKMLNILHAAWPAGMVLGGVFFLSFFQAAESWNVAKVAFWMMLPPVLLYGIMFTIVKRFPVDERVANNFSMLDMLREFGGLGAFLAITFLTYEVTTQLDLFPANRLVACLLIGLAGGLAFGAGVKSKGKWLFFYLCVIMIPLAAAELATDGWIRRLMEPSMGENAGWALVFSAAIMMVLRFFAGVPLRYLSPPALLLVSSLFSIVGLFFLSVSSGAVVFLAFVFYAVGQTFYWPTVLGLVAEQFPRGGAMTLNTVSAMGVLTVGIFGFPFLGAVQDHYDAQAIKSVQPEIVAQVKAENRTFIAKDKTSKPIYQDKSLFGVPYVSINTDAIQKQDGFAEEAKVELSEKLKNTGRSTLRVAAILPAFMAVAFFSIVLYFRRRGGYKPALQTNETVASPS